MNIVIYLLQNDASPDVPTVRGETPLHLAARANQTDIIRILLRNGAQVDARARVSDNFHFSWNYESISIFVVVLAQKTQNLSDQCDVSLYQVSKHQDNIVGTDSLIFSV